MRKLSFILSIIMAMNVFITFSANANKELEHTHNLFVSKIVDNVLKHQKHAFTTGRVLENRGLTKLDDYDELVVTYLSLPVIENVELVDFTYSVKDINWYRNENNKITIEAYVVRTLDWGLFESSYGDTLVFELKTRNEREISKLLNDEQEFSNTVILKDTTSSFTITAEEFLYIETKRRNEQYLNRKNNTISISHHDSGFRQSIGPYTWNPEAAKDYALQWALSRNPAYPDMTSSNCTNFVSQALHEGGIGMYYNHLNTNNGSWFIYSWGSEATGRSLTWINAGSFDTMLNNTNIIFSTKRTNAQQAKIADIFLYDYKDSLQRKNPDGWADHAAIVTGTNGYPEGSINYQPLVSYNSNERRNVLWSFFWAAEGGNYWVQHIHR